MASLALRRELRAAGDAVLDGSQTNTLLAPNRDASGRVGYGNQAYKAKRERLAKRVATLAAKYPHFPDDALPTLARLEDDAERSRSPTLRIRAANALRRMLAQLHAMWRPPGPTFEQLLGYDEVGNE
jgi:hypothetical protein